MIKIYSVVFCDHNRAEPANHIICRPNGTKDYLFLLILSPMHFFFKDSEQIAKPGACILYTPGYPQHYKSSSGFYNSYVHFTQDSDLLSEYSFPTNKLFYPSNTHEANILLQKIHTEQLIKPTHFKIQQNSYITQLLVYLDRNHLPQQTHSNQLESLAAEFQALRFQMFNRCEENWSIERMCQAVNLEKSQLYTYYKLFFHTSPKSELIHARIEKAKYLLTNEAMKISQVAEASGFTNVYHFTRYFKKNCKCTPSEFANNMSIKL